jgi:pimeloyl-ACP methyl ester carboxylesterase
MWHRRIAVDLIVVSTLIFSFGCLRDQLILHPSHDAISLEGAQEVKFARRDGGTTDAFLARSPGCHSEEPQAYVLDFTGNGTRAEMIAAALADRWQNRPVETIAVNYPGYGASTGPASMTAIPPMTLDAFDSVNSLAAGKPVIVTGHSLGCTAALYVAAHRPAAAMILQNPPPLRQLIVQEWGWWNLWLAAVPIALEIPPELDSIANARNYHEPAVLISSIHDHHVPTVYHKMVYDVYAGPHFPLSLDGDHDLSPDTSPDFPIALDWLWKQLRLQPPPPSTSPYLASSNDCAG